MKHNQISVENTANKESDRSSLKKQLSISSNAAKSRLIELLSILARRWELIIQSFDYELPKEEQKRVIKLHRQMSSQKNSPDAPRLFFSLLALLFLSKVSWKVDPKLEFLFI
jgi:hypothetical protein